MSATALSPSAGAGATLSAAPRLAWVDVAKGAAVLLVVAFHAGRLLTQLGVVCPEWLEVNRYLAQLRMPLFFALSGLFVTSVTRRGWSALWRSRLSLLVWTFGVWVLLRFAWFTLLPVPSRASERDVHRLLLAPVEPGNGLWFLHALVVFTVLARLTRAVSPRVQLGVAAAVAMAVLCVCATPETYPQRVGAYYVFFIGAGLLAQPLRRWAVGVRARAVWGLGGVFGLGAFVVVTLRVQQLMLPLGVVAVLLGVALAARVPRAAARPLGWLGARTLPIYVGHFLVLGCLSGLLLRSDLDLGPHDHGDAAHVALEAGLLLVVCAVSVAASLHLWHLARRGPLQVLYRPPTWFTTPVRRQEDRVGSRSRVTTRTWPRTRRSTTRRPVSSPPTPSASSPCSRTGSTPPTTCT